MPTFFAPEAAAFRSHFLEAANVYTVGTAHLFHEAQKGMALTRHGASGPERGNGDIKSISAQHQHNGTKVGLLVIRRANDLRNMSHERQTP